MGKPQPPTTPAQTGTQPYTVDDTLFDETAPLVPPPAYEEPTGSGSYQANPPSRGPAASAATAPGPSSAAANMYPGVAMPAAPGQPQHIHSHYYGTSPPPTTLYPGIPVAQVVHICASNQPIGYQIVDGRLLLSVSEPVRMWCPYDQREVVTELDRTAGCFAYSASAFLCCVAWPLFWVPFCTERCKDKVHRCPDCGNTLAIVPA
ncbi:LITAF-like zinc ribbon domain-containing protein [Entophlyctis helioformis]|nr:LITAF-like zinc ribbon domain-containing protein [Entophlyctis helioformis]